MKAVKVICALSVIFISETLLSQSLQKNDPQNYMNINAELLREASRKTDVTALRGSVNQLEGTMDVKKVKEESKKKKVFYNIKNEDIFTQIDGGKINPPIINIRSNSIYFSEYGQSFFTGPNDYPSHLFLSAQKAVNTPYVKRSVE